MAQNVINFAKYSYSGKGDFVFLFTSNLRHNRQLLDEVEHDIVNYQNRGLCYLPKPEAEADNTDTRF